MWHVIVKFSMQVCRPSRSISLGQYHLCYHTFNVTPVTTRSISLMVSSGQYHFWYNPVNITFIIIRSISRFHHPFNITFVTNWSISLLLSPCQYHIWYHPFNITIVTTRSISLFNCLVLVNMHISEFQNIVFIYNEESSGTIPKWLFTLTWAITIPFARFNIPYG